jgi:acetyltransferase-like isoleucine patch superfamily enzyme
MGDRFSFPPRAAGRAFGRDGDAGRDPTGVDAALFEELAMRAAKDATRIEIEKQNVIASIASDGSALAKYGDFFVGSGRWGEILKYDLIMLAASVTPGALGYALRKSLYRFLFARLGRGVNFGRNVSLRCPSRMCVGDRVAIDDDCALDARGAEDSDGFVIGDDTLVARQCFLGVKHGRLRIGRRCSIGPQTVMSAVSAIEIGDDVLVAGQCYVGGARYHAVRGAGPMAKQGVYSEGPVTIGDDVWLGAGARIIDGVQVGAGAIIGAGAVVTRSVPPNAIAVGVPARVVGERS